MMQLSEIIGAGNETRTRDPDLGKIVSQRGQAIEIEEKHEKQRLNEKGYFKALWRQK